MSSDSSSEPSSSYFADAEHVAEMARLTKQGHLLTERMGVMPASVDLTKVHTVLDIGCGPGEWALDVAQQHPDCQVIGIDISEVMTGSARAWAQHRQIANAHFRVMDARKPLDFPDASFDLIHGRLLFGFLTTETWPQLFQECYRLLQPGGICCSSEVDNMGVMTSAAMDRYNTLFVEAMRRTGHCFTSEGSYVGITAVQARLLQDAGFQNIEQQCYLVNYSAGMPAHDIIYDDTRTLLKGIQPFLVGQNLITQEEIDTLYERVLLEMQEDTFCAVWYHHRAWGRKA
ncbi:MAG TPA: methyltransferase domain-containing protein [Ktedonobacteraceae bacterium]|nr:methyltransferase domain-containing protein [Ktedonobacteraceae bacterium]